MKHLKHTSLALAALLSAGYSAMAQQQAKLVEKVDAVPGKAIIAYEKYKLPNGLTLIVHEDHSDPICHVEVTYHTGSARETPGRSGFAHFFEHMMFQGSEHVADEEHFKIVEGAGGDMNGTTNRDRTNYFETLPNNMLETALWLEADRMGFLLPAVTQQKFEVQRSTVKNEKDQRYGQPYGQVSEIMDQILYPAGHPYSWQTIGYVEDLNNANVEDLKNFFMRWYGPNNAIVVVAGDVKTPEVVAMVEKYFGSINKGPDVNKQIVPRNNLPEKIMRTVTDDVYFPLTTMTYPGVPNYHPDEAPLDLLAALLSDGKNSVFYKNFIKSEKAVQASVFNPSFELAGEFTVQVAAYPDITDKEVRDIINQCYAQFEKDGIKDEDLARVKEDMISSFYGGLESIAGKSALLTGYEMVLSGKQYNVQNDIDRYRNVTKEDILRVFNKYIKDKNYASVYVEQDPLLKQDPNAKIKMYESKNPYANMTDPNAGQFKGLSYVKPVDNFDRSKKPAPPSAVAANVPDFYKYKLDNGLEVIGSKSNETNRVYMNINIKGGHLFEIEKVLPGTAVFTAAMLNEGTQKYTSAEISDELQKLGSTINFSASNQGINASITCYKEKLPQTMALLEQKLLYPNFDAEDFKVVKKALLESIRNQRTSAGLMANKGFLRLLYGNENPLGTISSGDYATANKITLANVMDFYKKFMSPNLTRVVVTGDISEDEAKSNLAFLKTWENKNLTLPEFSNFPNFNTTQVFLINKPFSKQSNLIMGYRSLPYDITGDFYKANLMNFVLGGNFNSRLNLKIREDKGWTYGIRSGYSSSGKNYPGYFVVSAGIKTQATDSAIVEVMSEIKNFREKGISDEELAFTKSSVVSSDALRYETPLDKAGFLSLVSEYNLDKDFRKQQAAIVNSITKEEINALAKKYLAPENMIIMVVGDEYVIKEKLEGLGYGKVQVLDSDGKGSYKVYKNHD